MYGEYFVLLVTQPSLLLQVSPTTFPASPIFLLLVTSNHLLPAASLNDHDRCTSTSLHPFRRDSVLLWYNWHEFYTSFFMRYVFLQVLGFFKARVIVVGCLRKKRMWSLPWRWFTPGLYKRWETEHHRQSKASLSSYDTTRRCWLFIIISQKWENRHSCRMISYSISIRYLSIRALRLNSRSKDPQIFGPSWQ